MAFCNITLLMSSDILDRARATVMWPQLVQSNVEGAQIAYDLTLVVSVLLTILFLPFLMVLATIQTQNFMLNQTTNTRFSMHRLTNVSEAMIATLAEEDSSCDEDGRHGVR